MAVGRRELMLGTLGMGLLPAPRSSPAIQSAVRRTARSAPVNGPAPWVPISRWQVLRPMPTSPFTPTPRA